MPRGHGSPWPATGPRSCCCQFRSCVRNANFNSLDEQRLDALQAAVKGFPESTPGTANWRPQVHSVTAATQPDHLGVHEGAQPGRSYPAQSGRMLANSRGALTMGSWPVASATTSGARVLDQDSPGRGTAASTQTRCRSSPGRRRCRASATPVITTPPCSPTPVSVTACAAWPGARSSLRTRAQHHPPCQVPWTSTNCVITFPPHASLARTPAAATIRQPRLPAAGLAMVRYGSNENGGYSSRSSNRYDSTRSDHRRYPTAKWYSPSGYEPVN